MDGSSPWIQDKPFSILLRSPGDLVILATPSWFNADHLAQLVLLLLLAVVAVGARAWFVDRTVRAKVAALGYLEYRRD